MTIEELEHKHFIIPDEAYMASDKHTKLSIQFTIDVLEESITDTSYHEVDSFCKSKIQELKQYLDE